IELTKDGALASADLGLAGDTIEYDFTVRNTGSVTLTGVTLTDPKPGLSTIEFAVWPGAPGVLTAGQSVTATATYTVTAADVSAGRVSNTASVSGLPPAGARVSDTDPATVTLPELE